MLTRWGCQYSSTVTVKRIKTRDGHRRQLVTLRPLDVDGFVWPTLAELERVQSRYAPRTLPHELVERDDGLIVHGERLWIPAEATELVQRLMIIVHCRQQDHRGR